MVPRLVTVRGNGAREVIEGSEALAEPLQAPVSVFSVQVSGFRFQVRKNVSSCHSERYSLTPET
jgi:hypothetical protein